MSSPFHIQAQPDETTCGPTCLQAVYAHYGDEVPLAQVIRESHALEGGGTLAVFLANHALRRGYRATIHPYNVQVFDPSWFELPPDALLAKMRAQAETVTDRKRAESCRAYLEYLELGGTLKFADLTPTLIRNLLRRKGPILTGLSASWLYREVREHPVTFADDDIGGNPVGHFVVLADYDREQRTVLIADPYHDNPLGQGQIYPVKVDRVINAILLGIVTYDANLLLIEPAKGKS